MNNPGGLLVTAFQDTARIESNQVPGGTRLLFLCTWPYEAQFLQLQEPTDQTQLGSPTVQLYIFRGICKVLLAVALCSLCVVSERHQKHPQH